jgi:hypothetical protein
MNEGFGRLSGDGPEVAPTPSAKGEVTEMKPSMVLLLTLLAGANASAATPKTEGTSRGRALAKRAVAFNATVQGLEFIESLRRMGAPKILVEHARARHEMASQLLARHEIVSASVDNLSTSLTLRNGEDYAGSVTIKGPDVSYGRPEYKVTEGKVSSELIVKSEDHLHLHLDFGGVIDGAGWTVEPEEWSAYRLSLFPNGQRSDTWLVTKTKPSGSEWRFREPYSRIVEAYLSTPHGAVHLPLPAVPGLLEQLVGGRYASGQFKLELKHL